MNIRPGKNVLMKNLKKQVEHAEKMSRLTQAILYKAVKEE